MELQHMKQLTDEQLHDAIHQEMLSSTRETTLLRTLENEHRRRMLMTAASINFLAHDAYTKKLRGDW